MELDNLFEVVVHLLLIEGMIGLDHQDGIPMASVLAYMVTYWIGPIVSHNIKLLGSLDFTKLLSMCKS